MSKFQFPLLQYQWRNSNWRNIPGKELLNNQLYNNALLSGLSCIAGAVTSIMTKSSSDVAGYYIMVDLSNIRLDQCSFNHLQFRFIQREHRGGFCDCWAVANLTATLTSGEVKDLRYILRLF